MPLLTWGIGEITGDVAIQRLLPKITLATVAGLVLSVPLAYFSARAVQRKYNLFNKD
ncbi:hypothetical protein HYU95_05835 [Candidatus Daviesbacteria bacterium]|nr:hypothetical protein [Candidatus Daviesbacteria bacterium]